MTEVNLITLSEKNIVQDRDYSLDGSRAKKALELGLSSAQRNHKPLAIMLR